MGWAEMGRERYWKGGREARRGLRREGEWRERRRECAGRRKPSLETMVRSGGKLVTRVARLDERPSAWLVACKETICEFQVSSSTKHMWSGTQGATTCTDGRELGRPTSYKRGQERPRREANKRPREANNRGQERPNLLE